jgi:hypothetical protein
MGNDLDQKQTIVNFLASVVYEAEALGITYEKVYYPNNSLVQDKIKNAAISGNIFNAPLPAPIEPIPNERPQEEDRNL